MLQNYTGPSDWKISFRKMLKGLLVEVRFYLFCTAANIFPRIAVNIYQIFAFRWLKLYVMIKGRGNNAPFAS